MPLLFLLFLTACLACPTHSFADDDNEEKTEIDEQTDKSVRSFQKDYFMGILYKKMSDGKGMFDFDGTEQEKRKEINKAIAEGTTTQKYSLFDRFGGDISFALYLGEEQVKTGLADKVYTAVVEDSQDGFSITKIIDLIARKDAVYTDTYYQGRPLLKSDGSDPRVNIYENIGAITIGEAIVCATANYFLGTSKIIVGIVSYLASGKYVEQVKNFLLDFVNTNAYKSVGQIFSMVIAIASVTLAVFALKNLIAFLKNGTTSLNNFLLSLAGCGLSLGLILVLTTSPQAFINLSANLLSLGDTITADALNDANQDDEIVSSDSLDNVVEAALWEEAVFKPWVRGVFGDVEYKDLYTTYSNKDNKWDVETDAAAAYGDVKVLRSTNQADTVKNWAALAYSCQSIYHLDATEEEQDTSKEFPIAAMAGQSTYLYQDDFRWIDAMYKVGHYDSDKANKNLDEYVGARNFNFDGVVQGMASIWLSILLIPIGVLGFKKLKAALSGLGSFAIFLYRSAVNVIVPTNEQYYVLGNIKACAVPILNYLFYTVLIFVGITFYRGFGTNENFLLQLLYLCLVIYMCMLKPYDVIKKCRPSNIKSFAKQASSDVKEKLSNYREDMQNASFERMRKKVSNLPTTTQEIDKRAGDRAAKNSKESQTDTAQEKTSLYGRIEKESKQLYKELELAKIEAEQNPSVENMQKVQDLTRKKEEKTRQLKQLQGTKTDRITSYRSAEKEKKKLLHVQYDNKENLGKKELKKLKKSYKKSRREFRANTMQDALNKTFNTKGGSIIPPIIKLYILLGLVALYFIGLIITIIAGG